MTGPPLIVLALGILATPFAALFVNNIGVLNANSGSATVLLTILLVLITAYYAWETKKIRESEGKTRLRSIRPIVHIEVSAITFKVDPDMASSDPLYNTILSFKFEVTCFNGSAIGPHLSFEAPCRLDKSAAFYEYVQFTPTSERLALLEHGGNWSGPADCITHSVSDFSPPKENIYVVADMTYEDLDQNLYSHRAYFKIFYMDLSRMQSRFHLSKVYEEVHMLAFDKRGRISREFDPERVTTVTSRLQ